MNTGDYMKKTNLPIEYIEEMKTILKEDFLKYENALKESTIKGLQVN